MKDERTRASRRRFKEGQLRPILRPLVAGFSVLLILAGGFWAWLSGIDWSGFGDVYHKGIRIGWSLVGVGIVLLLWSVLSGVVERRGRERAREARARKRDGP